jgi:hypothetical protein
MRMTDTKLHDVVHALGYGMWPPVDDVDHHTCAAQRIWLPVLISQWPAQPTPGTSNSAAGSTQISQVPIYKAPSSARPTRAKGHNLAFIDRLASAIHASTARDDVGAVRHGEQAFERAHISTNAAHAFNGFDIPDVLSLNIGSPVYVALNLDCTEGIVTGALAVVLNMHTNMVCIRFLNPRHPDQAIWPLPRVCFQLQPDQLPLNIERRQDPFESCVGAAD